MAEKTVKLYHPNAESRMIEVREDTAPVYTSQGWTTEKPKPKKAAAPAQAK